jgi:CRP/FNR family transcriptional regulator, cyclic AMP receptor protein
MENNKGIWFFEEVDLYEILCPYKYSDYIKSHPLSTFNKNDFLFMEGDASREVYLVADGKLKVGYYDDIGNEYVIAFLGRGEILGEMSIFGNTKHKNFAQIVRDNTMICKLSAEKARELARDYVPFSLTLNKMIGERMQKVERRLQILLFKDARQRLIEFLKDLCRDIGKPYRSGVKIDLDITQSDIASLIGTSRKTVSLLFTDLEEIGLVTFFGRKEIYVPNVEKLI